MSKTSLALFGMVLAASLSAGGASAQDAPPAWQTPAGGDASGDHIRIELLEPTGVLRGARRVERIDAPSGYTTGTLATVVFTGSEPERARSLRIHLPYGARLDLAVGDAVDVDATAQRRGHGSVHEIVVKRRGELVLLTTARDSAGGVTVARGEEQMPRERSRRRFGRRVRIGDRDLALPAGVLAHVAQGSLLAQGSEVVYEGVRPPEGFDTRVLTLVRIAPLASSGR